MEGILRVINRFRKKPASGVAGPSLSPEQELVRNSPMDKLGLQLEKKGVEINKLNRALQQEGGVVTNDIDVFNYVKAFWLVESDVTPIDEIKISQDFSYRKTLEDIYCRITRQQISFKEEPYVEFGVAIGDRKFNLAIHVDQAIDPNISDIDRFIRWTRSYVQTSQVKVVLYSENNNTIPVELAKQLTRFL